MTGRISISEIVDEIIGKNSAGQSPLVVFDLDSTLFNVSLRTQKIVETFVNDPAIREKFSSEVAELSALKITPRDWGLRRAIERSGIQVTEAFAKTLRDYWRSRFFSSEFLDADRPYPGSREAVLQLNEAGAQIIYLTGRDERNMKIGTVDSLKRWGFPLNFEKPELHSNDDSMLPANLIMKPIKGSIEDEEFKEIEMQKIVEKFKSRHRDIWFFENEPIIIERVRSATPVVHLIWVDTTHSGRGENPTDLPILVWRDF